MADRILGTILAGGQSRRFRSDKALAVWRDSALIEHAAAALHRSRIPELKPGDIVILDNLSGHKGQEPAALVKACGATLFFLPPYSPDLNPIEMVFAKLKAKHLLRKAGERTRTGLWNRVGSLLEDFPPQQCKNYFRHAG